MASGVGLCTAFPWASRTLSMSRGFPPGRARLCADTSPRWPTRRWWPRCVELGPSSWARRSRSNSPATIRRLHTIPGTSRIRRAGPAAGRPQPWPWNVLSALGTQTGGSLVRPAAYCRVATCKPTFGKLSMEGIVPVSTSLDHPGPMARKVVDVALLLNALLGMTTQEPLRPLGSPRFGVLQRLTLEDADAAVREATQSALERLTHAGAELQPLVVPRMFADAQLCTDESRHELPATASVCALAPSTPRITELLDEGSPSPWTTWRKQWQHEFRHQAAHC